MGGARAHYGRHRGLLADHFTGDPKKIAVPVLVVHSEDDQIVLYVASGPLSAKLLRPQC
jgi:non-heme chloroperoxidase